MRIESQYSPREKNAWPRKLIGKVSNIGDQCLQGTRPEPKTPANYFQLNEIR